MTSPGPRARTRSRLGGSWALYKKVQDLFGNTQGSLQLQRTPSPATTSPISCWACQHLQRTRGPRPRPLEQRFLGRLCSGQLARQPPLTLNLGLRWDGVPHTYEANDRMGNFYPNLYNPANAAIFVPDPERHCDQHPAQLRRSQSGLGTSPNPILAGLPVLSEWNRHPGQDTWHSKGPGEQPLGELRSAPWLCL